MFALVNSYIKPIVKALSFPISLMTLGLVAFVINAALLLLVAWIDSATIKAGLVVGHFPPKIDADTIVAAIIGALVLSIVSTAARLRELRAKGGRAPLTRERRRPADRGAPGA